MGCSWLPDPPVGHHSPTDISLPTVFLADSDEDQQPVQTDDISIENDGYRLLSDFENQQDYDTVDEEVCLHFSECISFDELKRVFPLRFIVFF